ncbi:DTW domain-containing protein [Microbulbifer elongatus]|uniref:tRNA-uridine aminocarboxypropyltransferase n=1 Tax=Microbulbifer elongatus TaxID=86173 RepID=A0ABT1P4G3_9GAMM|nr:DTW domain-containing protein [Microbulbifer elongatus]
MQIILLTHERELSRRTNTGQLALRARDDLSIERIVWKRSEPSPELLRLINREEVALLYPVSETRSEVSEVASVVEVQNFILLDGTWQEARKMYNRSPYLHPLPRVDLNIRHASRFNLRRNQRDGCLCTAETVIEVLRAKGEDLTAQDVTARFTRFLAENA